MSYVVDVLVALAYVAGLFVAALLVIGTILLVDYTIIKVVNKCIKKLLG